MRTKTETKLTRCSCLLTVLITLLACGALADAQTFSVIHSFMGDGDGYQPFAGLLIDQGGNLYGTTTEYLGGSVFQMKPHSAGWTLSTLYQFVDFGQTIPQSRVVKGPGGALYGTTYTGGNSEDCWEFGCGTVYALRPPQTVCRTVSCSWSASYVEFDGTNGFFPGYGAPSFDAAGNMYVTTTEGGVYFRGNVAKLTRSGGVWTITSIHDFNGSDGYSPYSAVTIDAHGNLYGTTWYGGGHSTAPERFTVSALPVPVGPSRPCTPFRTAQGARCPSAALCWIRPEICMEARRKAVRETGERYLNCRRQARVGISPSCTPSPERGRRMVRSTPWRWTLREISTAPQLRTERTAKVRCSSSRVTMVTGLSPTCTISPAEPMAEIRLEG